MIETSIMCMRPTTSFDVTAAPAPIDEHGGKVYQYVGCTIVIT